MKRLAGATTMGYSTGMEREKTAKTSRIWLVAISATVLALVGCAATLAVAILRNSSSPFPPSVRDNANFTLYAPKGQPAGYKIDKTRISFDKQRKIVVIPLDGPNNHHATLSEQPLPEGLTFDTLLGKGKVIDDTPGQAAISNIEGRTVASMISTDHKTLILLNSANASADELTAIMKSLQSSH
jgi:hypothetical protein